LARQPPVGKGLHIYEVSTSHTTTHHSREDSSGWVISPSQRPLPTHHSQQRDIVAPGRIRTQNLSRRAAPQSVGVLWINDQPVAETCTYTTLTTDRHCCPRRDSNPESQQLSGTIVGRTPLDEWSAHCRDLYLRNTHNRQTSLSPAEFEPRISAGERHQTYVLDREANGTGNFVITQSKKKLVNCSCLTWTKGLG